MDFSKLNILLSKDYSEDTVVDTESNDMCMCLNIVGKNRIDIDASSFIISIGDHNLTYREVGDGYEVTWEDNLLSSDDVTYVTVRDNDTRIWIESGRSSHYSFSNVEK